MITNAIIAAFITGVLGPVIVLAIKRYHDVGKTKPDMLAETLAVSKQVEVKLEEIIEEFKADRVWITQFHNGGNFYPTGKSIAKFSVVYEVVSINVPSIQSSYNNIPVSLFSRSMNHLLEHNLIAIADFTDVKTATFGLKYVAAELGCKSTYLFAIKTVDGKFIGILGLDYTGKKASIDSEKINLLTYYAAAIGGVLSNHINK